MIVISPTYELNTKEPLMATRSTIMDTNSFRPDMADALDEQTRKLTEEREVLGPAYRLFYRTPVHLVKGRGARLWDADGTEYLDVYNNVASVGHANERVVQAITDQASQLNTHTRYLHENVLHYAEDILSTMPEEIDRIMFQCTGSEANDLAVRVAQTYTGGEGIIVTAEAYHGNTELTSALSPALGTAQPVGPTMRMIPTPDTYRLVIPVSDTLAPTINTGIAYSEGIDTDAAALAAMQAGLESGALIRAGEASAEQFGNWMAGEVHRAVADMNRHGIKFAGLLADSIFSSDGVYPDPVGFLKPVIDTVHELGGVWIADEVQPGFTRTGDAFWGFERQGIVPDLVTSGKPMANGLPTSLMAARHEVLEPFAGSIPYFNTFGGNPVCMGAAQATLNVMRDDDTQGNAKHVGRLFKEGVIALQPAHACIGDVRGAGLYIGCEIVKPGTKEPDQKAALDMLELLRDRHILTSVCGRFGNILKLRPPLVFTEDDGNFFLEGFESVLLELGL
ncbi:aminotransferase, class III [Bifidobacterium gallicum DSM 20093 = LMG 11596]|uniref:Aminotransferase, class III n=2 Tax=Bifidobacterium gallicum DSM 20093 = LMG 11596 TaxID=561180 RepID=D1NV74_9BIFI|nr:aminotransferase, class III [Bifidobacterium gallicum DSM 20093 = LMG 11596]